MHDLLDLHVLQARVGLLDIARAEDDAGYPGGREPRPVGSKGDATHGVLAGDAPDRLVGAASAVAKEVQVHEMSMADGVMKMRPVTGGLEIKPGATVTLKPGGYHVMFVGLAQPLKPGEHFKVTLEFAKAGKVDVDFTTEGIGAMHGGGDSMPGMKMH